VITEHWSRYLPSRNEYKGILRKALTWLVVRKSEGIVTVSQALKTAMVKCGLDHKNFCVIHNSVDTSTFKPGIRERHPKKVFSHISCFDNAAKNISGIIKAVKVLSETRNDFELHLIGGGPDFDRMEALSNSLGLNGNFVFYKGLLEGQDLVKAYQNSLFTVLFSNYENMPVVVAESFACGVPVIATQVGGLPEIVNASNGILVEKGDELELAEALNSMLNNYREYNPITIRHFAEQKFSTDVFRIAYYKFYNNFQNPNK
jgi:glycosyltransferase involved in cell wall biosynthesis